MSAVAIAAAAALCAAAGIVELAAVPRRPRRRLALAAAAVALLARLGGRLPPPPPPSKDLASRIEAAGAPFGLDAPQLAAAKAGAALVAMLVALALVSELPGRLPLLCVLLSPVAGYHGPDAWLRRRTRRRSRAMAAELADLLDLMRVAVEAGLAPARALAEVGRRAGPGQLATEWRRASAEIAVGVSHADALDRLVARCPLAEVAALAGALHRAEREGAALAPALAALATDVREGHARRLREHGASAAPKIQLVIALLLVPSVLLLLGAGIAAQAL